MDTLSLIGRTDALFDQDVAMFEQEIAKIIRGSRFLIIGGSGSIGQAVARELFKRDPKQLHVVDINENNLVEVVRDLRSTEGYKSGEFKTFALDCGSVEFDALIRAGDGYDFIFNLSALKHVRSEKDPYTLMRMLNVNIFNTLTTLRMAREMEAQKYFCVSTDKAANPVNLMGASKRIMELFLMRESVDQQISTARFANVAFSDGSLLHGFNQRFTKRQPFSAPSDVRRYFVTQREAGQLCVLSGLLGRNREIFFPKLSDKLHLITFSEIARRYLNEAGYEPVECQSEEEARVLAPILIPQKKWPCYFFNSDTTGEKDFEEFFTSEEPVDLERFEGIGVVRNDLDYAFDKLQAFTDDISAMRARGEWSKHEIVRAMTTVLDNLSHKETGKYLDDRM